MNNIYVLVANDEENSGTFYYVFDNKDYFEAYIFLAKLRDSGEIKNIDEIINNLKNNKGIFCYVTKDMLKEVNYGKEDFEMLFPKDSYKITSSFWEFKKFSRKKEISETVNLVF